jgi:protein-S-isoprenylcysteine O-methyltransferase Ste14
MASQLVAPASAAESSSNTTETSPGKTGPPSTIGQRFVRLLVRRRVHISSILFTAIVLVDLFVFRSRPRNLADPLAVGGVLLVLCGLAIRSWAAGTLRKRRALATSGPYAWIRHPLYFGSFLMMLGFGTLIQDPLTLLVVFGPVAWLYWQAMKTEERHIRKLFPHQWPPYAAKVPRLIPWRPVRLKLGDWSLSQWLHNTEYQAWIWSALALVGIQIWHNW